jgi:hypothetical protein
MNVMAPKTRVPSDRAPKKQNGQFLENGSNDCE